MKSASKEKTNKNIILDRTSLILITMVIFVLIVAICYYNIFFDIALISFLILDSFMLGNLFKVNGNLIEKVIMRTAIGLGTIGLIIYYILLIGIGNKSVYLFLLAIIFCFMCPLIYRRKQEIHEIITGTIKYVKQYRLLVCVILFVGIGYLIYASAPIKYYDSLTKHLPISMYAAETGQWYTNITESIVYGEPMVLQYTYSAMFLSMGAYKALTIFNVMLYFCTFIILCYFIKSIYKQSNLWIFAIIFFTTPFFLEFSTIFYLEILPLYFLFSAFVGIGNIRMENIWENIEVISLLCGFSLFVKLTHTFTLVIMASILIFCCIRYAIKFKFIKEGIKKMCLCVFLVIFPSITSLINIWYKTGNPLFPSYNGIFKSPYFIQQNFSDPFKNELSFSLKSLIDIVFYTTKNVEMYPLAMGFYLLFIFLIPVTLIILIRKKQYKHYAIWAVISLVSFQANTLSSYNLRYYFSVWILLACIITIGISVCAQFSSIKAFNSILLVVVGCVILFPNMYFIYSHNTVLYKCLKNENLVNRLHCDLLELIPEGKSVYSVTNSNQFKGDYKGYFASSTWHNTTNNRVIEGEYTWDEYISSFDYILIDKLRSTNNFEYVSGKDTKRIDIMMYIEPFLGEKCGENDASILYKTTPQKSIVLQQEYETMQECSVEEPIFEAIPNESTCYYISHDIFNDTETSITMRFQINWMTQEHEFINTSISTYEALPGENTYYSEGILANEEADYGIVYVCTADEKKIKVKSYTVEAIEVNPTLNIIDIETERYKNRAYITR